MQTTAEIGLVRPPALDTSSPSPRPDGDEASCHCQNGRNRKKHTQMAGDCWGISDRQVNGPSATPPGDPIEIARVVKGLAFHVSQQERVGAPRTPVRIVPVTESRCVGQGEGVKS